MSNNILAITTAEDPHVDMVSDKLKDRGSILIYDPNKFPEDTDITISFINGNHSVISEGRVLSDVRSVWFRKPKYLKPSDQPVENEFRAFTQEAYELGSKAIYDLLRNKFWMSPFRNILSAGNKMLQLELAQEVGFNVPATVLTNNPNDVMTFRNEFGQIVAKSLNFHPVQLEDGNLYGFYTTSISPKDDVDFSGLALAPTIFQQEILDKVDVRVTIVGNEIFPCLIRPTKRKSTAVDWREGIMTDEVEYTAFPEFPENMRLLCIQMVKKLGLTFSAMEFVIDKDGKYWFIENNPNGQWAFIEDETGMPISESIAELLWKSGKR